MDPIIWGLREKEKKKEWKLRSVFCYLIDDGRRVLLIKNREKIEQKAKKKNFVFHLCPSKHLNVGR